MPAHRIALFGLLTAISAASGSGVERPPASYTNSTMTRSSADARPLPFFYDLYTFRGRGGRTAIVSAFAVEAGELEAESVNGRARYRFSVTLVLADTARRSVAGTHDTVYVDLPHSLTGEHLLYTHVEVLAPPSRTTNQRVIMNDATTPGIGRMYSEYFPIPDYSGDHLMISDIALGQPDARSGWKRGNVALALLPTSQFPSSAFDVYYEIYNLPRGNRYVTEVAVDRADPGAAHDPVLLRFSGESAAGGDDMVPELRSVSASLPRGSYTITVTIRDLTSGQTARRSRPFEVRGWERGTTMVAALRAADWDSSR